MEARLRLWFVSRATHEDALAQRDRAQAEVKRLTDTIIDMKVTGATVRAAVNGDRPRLVLPPKPETELDRALNENTRTRNDQRLAARTRAWAEREIAAAKGDEEKIEAILNRVRGWNTVTTEDDDSDDEAVIA
jgi:hypothetical protein